MKLNDIVGELIVAIDRRCGEGSAQRLINALNKSNLAEKGIGIATHIYLFKYKDRSYLINSNGGIVEHREL